MGYQILSSRSIYKQQLSSKAEAIVLATIAITPPELKRRIAVPLEGWKGEAARSLRQSPLRLPHPSWDNR